MATEKQILANRRNSQQSTGPRSEAGKSITRMNALKSGLHAESHVIRGEDPEALAQLTAEYNAEFRPATPRERDLVDVIVHNEWKIRRLRAIETALWAWEFERFDANWTDTQNSHHVCRRRHPLATAFDEDLEKRLENLQRRLHAYERSTARALKQLKELKESATSEQIGFVPSSPVEQPSQVSMPACEPACPADTVPPLSPIGFVPAESPHPAPSENGVPV